MAQLKKRNRKAAYQALLTAGIPTCAACHRSLSAPDAPCHFRKCPTRRVKKDEIERESDEQFPAEKFE